MAKPKKRRKTASAAPTDAAQSTARKSEVVGSTKVYEGHHTADIMRIPDPESGTPVMVLRVSDQDTIDAWHKKGTIETPEYAAGCDFRRDFYEAGLAGHGRSPNPMMGRVDCSGGDFNPIEGNVQSLRAVRRVLDRLGHRSGDCVWYVVGLSMSLRQYAERCRHNGDSMTHDKAGGILLAALEQMAFVYGHRSRAK